MMDKLIKKALHTAVGIVAGTTERLQHAIDDLVAKGKITADEGRKVVDDVVKTTDHKKEEYEGKFKNLIDSVIAKLNFSQGESYEKLEKRVKSLEVKLGLLAKELELQRKAEEELKEREDLADKKAKKTKKK
jgi:polyhydroxyalkanoate synthesis regulator phasin